MGDRREISAVLQNSQLPLSKVATLYFDELVILDPVGARWTITGKEQA